VFLYLEGQLYFEAFMANYPYMLSSADFELATRFRQSFNNRGHAMSEREARQMVRIFNSVMSGANRTVETQESREVRLAELRITTFAAKVHSHLVAGGHVVSLDELTDALKHQKVFSLNSIEQKQKLSAEPQPTHEVSSSARRLEAFAAGVANRLLRKFTLSRSNPGSVSH
jgi:hypothetical protein